MSLLSLEKNFQNAVSGQSLEHVNYMNNTVELGYNDIGLYDTSSITSDILWYKLIPHC
jgi:hypothetical protein